MQRFALVIGLAVLLAVLFGCVEGEKVVDRSAIPSAAQPTQPAGMAVTALLADLDRYLDTEVIVYGKVHAGLAFEFVGEQPYQLATGDSRLWVVTSGPVPADGSWVTVRGIVKAPYQLKGRHYPVALVERARMP